MTIQLEVGHRWRLLALALAMLLPSLGTSIANVALPTLTGSFDASFQDVQWVVLSYLLAVTTLIVSAGRLGDMLGRRRLLLAGIVIFAVASASCVIAPSLWALIAGRAVQGFGAAVMMSLTVALASDVVPRERMGSAMGLLGTVSAIGTALGPSLGGFLISWFGWPAVFVFLAAAGGVSFWCGLLLFPPEASANRKPFSFDVAGTFLLAFSLGAYSLAATLGGSEPGLTSGIFLGTALLGFAAFALVESRVVAPLIEMQLLRDGALNANLLSMTLVSTIMMATLVVGPFYLSDVLGLGPVNLGLVMSIGPGVAALVGMPAGRVVDRLGSSVVVLAGLAGVVIGSGAMTVLPSLMGVGGYISALALITAGYALFQAGNSTAVMDVATKEHRGVTSALLGLSRNLGLITGASVMGAIFAVGSRGVPMLRLGSGSANGMTLTFAVAAGLALIALAVTLLARR